MRVLAALVNATRVTPAVVSAEAVVLRPRVAGSIDAPLAAASHTCTPRTRVPAVHDTGLLRSPLAFFPRTVNVYGWPAASSVARYDPKMDPGTCAVGGASSAAGDVPGTTVITHATVASAGMSPSRVSPVQCTPSRCSSTAVG